MCVASRDLEGAPLLQIIHLLLKSLVWRLSWTRRFFLSVKTLLQNAHLYCLGFELTMNLEKHLSSF